NFDQQGRISWQGVRGNDDRRGGTIKCAGFKWTGCAHVNCPALVPNQYQDEVIGGPSDEGVPGQPEISSPGDALRSAPVADMRRGGKRFARQVEGEVFLAFILRLDNEVVIANRSRGVQGGLRWKLWIWVNGEPGVVNRIERERLWSTPGSANRCTQ